MTHSTNMWERRLQIVGIAGAALAAALGLIALLSVVTSTAQTQQDPLAEAFVNCYEANGFSYVNEPYSSDGLHVYTAACVDEAQAVPTEPEATATVPEATATETQVPPTATAPEPTATATEPSEPTAVGNTWHAPGAHDGLAAHEHGDAPPQWVTDFSMENFGHGLIYGGDEGTPNENQIKHWAFKGYHVTFLGDGPDGQDDAGGPVEIYFRNHMQGNPMGHMARFHSYEVYAKDAAGNVSFWQGWLDFALPGTTVPHIADGDCENDTQRPIMGVNKLACDPYTFESWYSRPGGPNGFWTWDTGVNLQAPYYHDAEDPMDPSTWHRAPDGNVGLERRVELAWYADRASDVPKDTWFCTLPNGQGVGLAQNNSPDGCGDGELPQYIASSMPSVTFTQGANSPATGANSTQKVYPGAGVVEPLN